MHEIIDYLKAVVDKTEFAGVYSCYVVRDDNIYARNVTMQAGLPMPSKVPFNIPAQEINRALGRMKNVDKLTIKDGKVIIKAGRLKVEILVNTDEAQGVPVMPDEFTRAPAGLANALALALPFKGDQGYSDSIQLRNGKVQAISGQRAIAVDLPGLQLEQSMMITKDVAEFIIANGDPDEYHQEERALVVRWEDGRWMRAQLLNYEAPDANVDKIFDNAGSEAPIAINAEWREVYDDAVALSPNGVICVTPKALLVQDISDIKYTAQVDYTTPGLPKDHKTFWDHKFMEPIIKYADYWNPLAYPAPALFVGKGFKGVVMGRSRW